jgi:hypothetical protein
VLQFTAESKARRLVKRLEKWFSESGDVRDDEVIMQSVIDA